MLKIHHGNRLEDLLERLAGLLESPLSRPLEPELLVVQNQGMETWLSQQLALRNGIAANLEFPLPATFVWRMLAGQLRDVPEENRFGSEGLLWACLDLLPQLMDRPGFELPRRYLQGPDPERKAYQLAKRVADLFDQYLVYRHDWILAWERGEEEHWQAQLWRALVDRLGNRHRARLLDEFLHLDRLAPDRLPERVALFGLTAQPPVYLAVLQRLAQATDVHLFVPNPSLAYWGDIEPERHLARLRSHWSRAGRPDVSNYYSVGNPLLASLGKVGRDFHELLQALQADAEEEGFQEPEGDGLLHQIQRDILELVDRRHDGAAPRTEGDVSLQIHLCHGPLREVQVLHDSLLDLFERLPGLRPREVVVMAPDIGAYAPTIEAVFGAAPEVRHIPWSVADLGVASLEPLAQTFLDLLDLPSARLTASEVLGLLEVPALARRFRIPDEAMERVRDWVSKSGIRWGSDGPARGELGLPEGDAHTWRFGLRRLMLGHALPEGEHLFAGYLPQPGVAGSEAPWLGGLHELIERLDHWRRQLAQPATPLVWRDRLQDLLDDLFAPQGGGSAARGREPGAVAPRDTERYVLQEVRDALGHFAELAGDTQIDLGHAVIHEHLTAEMGKPARGRRFLAGQVTFCNMVPMRSIPFRVVCLLGMNDADFPRNRRPPSFDRMGLHPRLGDRSLREDDRYLFLEALLSAREVFYLSYQGRDRRDNEPRLPSVLVSELLDYLERSQGLGCAQAITTEHPLQPFSPNNFRGTASASAPQGGGSAARGREPGAAALQGGGSAARGREPGAAFAEEWLVAARTRPIREQAPFVAEPLPPLADATLELEALIAFFRHPVRYFLQKRLGLYPEGQETALEDNEPFALDGWDGYLLRHDSLRRQLAGLDFLQAIALEQASGRLPEGSTGEIDFRQNWGRIQPMVEKLAALGGSAVEPPEVDLALGPVRLQGRLRHLTNQGLRLYRPAKLKAAQRIELWLRHLVLNAIAPPGVACESRCLTLDRDIHFGPISHAVGLLQPWIEAYLEGMRRPLHFVPQVSLTFAEQLAKGKSREEALGKATNEWRGNEFAKETPPAEDIYHRIAFRYHSPIDDTFADLAESLLLPLLEKEGA